MLKWWLLIAGGVVLGSCNQKKNQVEQAALPQTTSATKPQLVYRPTGPDFAVHDLLPVNSDTLIAVKWNGGIAVTTDAGNHWKGLHDQRKKPDFLFIKYLTIDQHHVLWGLDSWKGIHEPPYSRLAYSDDFGVTWTWQKFDTHAFFPYELYSHPGQALQVVTYDGKVYQIQDRAGKKWEFIQGISELNYSMNDTIPGDAYFAGARFKFLETGQLFLRSRKKWRPIAKARFINELYDACQCKGNTYMTGQNSAADPPIHYFIRAAEGQVQDSIRTQEEQQQLRCDSQGRLWLFSFRGIWLKSGSQFLKRF